MSGLLVRVGIDGTPKYGHWNAPVDADTNRFVFVPISDCSYNSSREYIPGGERTFEEVVPELARLVSVGNRITGVSNYLRAWKGVRCILTRISFV